MNTRLGPLAIASLCLLAAGCATATRTAARTELEAVAKDWSRLVRASQVVPVYPLTEDLRPGDVFLVDTPLEEIPLVFDRDGFLPLDQHVVRLEGVGVTPPVPGADTAGWDDVPRAAFPSYSFDVRRGAALRLGLPVQGVPIGLSLLGSGSATGTIAIADAFTYGATLQDVERVVRAWEAESEARTLLAEMRARARGPLLLRVVSRVYLASRVTVSLVAGSETGGGVDAGSAVGGAPLAATDGSGEDYEGLVAAINKGLASSAAPGGSLRLVGVSQRSVAIDERFPRPLVIGYLAYDFPLLEGGGLGAPLPARARQADLALAEPVVRPGERGELDERYRLLTAAIASLADDARARVYESAVLQLPEEFATAYRGALDSGLEPARAFARARTGYLVGKSPLDRYLRPIVDALDRAWRQESP